MPTATVSQILSDPTAPLDSPLTRDAIITVRWSVQDVPNGQSVGTQECTLLLEADHGITAQVDSASRTYSFRLSKGTLLPALPLHARVRANFTAQAPAVAIPAVTSANANVEFASRLVPEREAISTVYGELNTELRRTRTLYESFLVAVTAALATLYSKRDVIAGATHRGFMLIGLAALTIIVVYMLWAVSRRYTRAISWVGNLEKALGVRQGDPPADLMPDKARLWKEGAWQHTLWAIMLTAYVGVLVASAGYLLRAKPEPPAPTPPAQTQTVICDCARPTDTSRTPPPGGKSAAPSPPKATSK